MRLSGMLIGLIDIFPMLLIVVGLALPQHSYLVYIGFVSRMAVLYLMRRGRNRSLDIRIRQAVQNLSISKGARLTDLTSHMLVVLVSVVSCITLGSYWVLIVGAYEVFVYTALVVDCIDIQEGDVDEEWESILRNYIIEK